MNIQRSLGNIGDFYAGNVLLPLDLIGGNNPVLDLNAHEDMNIQQQFVSNLENMKANDVINNLPFELAYGNNNQVFNLDEEHDNDNDNDNDDDEDDDEEVEDKKKTTRMNREVVII